MDIAVLGTLEVRDGDGRPVRLPGARLRTLLILLALDAGRTVPTGRLVDSLWGDEPPAAAGNALQSLVSRLRRALPDVTVQAMPTGYRLAVDPDCVDAHRFAGLAAAGRATLADDPEGAAATLRRAVQLWRGAALADLTDATADGVRGRLAALDELRYSAWEDLFEAELTRGGGAELVPELEELVAAHPLRETFAAQLMRALAAAGRPGAALAAYDGIRRHLRDTLGADPGPALAGAHLQVLRRGTAPVRKGNLPSPLSSFVGRTDDVTAVLDLVGAGRLTTLTGPGGSGKTRLSIEVGRALPDPPGDGVWLVELAGVTEPAEVPQAVLTALHLGGRLTLARRGGGWAAADPDDGDPVARVVDALAGRDLLLVLDNCEHLIGAVADLVERVLLAGPALRVLASSREPLGIPGEQLWAVEPLALPPAGIDADRAAAYPAVRLLLDRAAAARPGLTLDATTVAPVVRICAALDGMPLAIELAAARMRTLPVPVLAERLVDRFRLLTAGSRTALPRHQTLRAVVDWSWDLLDEPERVLWRRFTVFAGGAELPLVEQVCAGGPVDAGAVLDLLGALVDKSLIVLVGTRYRMLETIREYGRERLAAAGEAEELRLAHARAMITLAGAAEPALRGPDQLVWLARLAAEHDNLHAALRAAVAAREAGTAVALAARLGWYWWLRGHRAEGSLLGGAAADLPGDVPRHDRALAYACAALNGTEGAAPDDIRRWFAEAIRLHDPASPHPLLRLVGPVSVVFDRLGDNTSIPLLLPLRDDPDPWLRAVIGVIIAQVWLNGGHQQDTAEAELTAALAGFRQVGDRWGVGFTLSELGDLASTRGEFARAVQWQREGIALVREVGSREDVPQLQAKLAHQLRLLGDVDGARDMLAQARVSADEIGFGESHASVEYVHAEHARYDGALDAARAHLDRAVAMLEGSTFASQFRANLRCSQGMVAAAAGDPVTARRLLDDALALVVPTRDAPVLAHVLVGLADLAVRTDDPERAARLLGAGEAVRGGRDHSWPDAGRVELAARQALGDEAYDEAHRAGLGSTYASAAEAAGFTAA